MNAYDRWPFFLLTLLVLGLAPVEGAINKNRLPETVEVSGMRPCPELHGRVTGLAFAVEDAGWPALRILDSDYLAAVIGAYGGSTGHAGHLEPRAVLPGCVAAGEGGRLKSQRANSVSNTLVFGNDENDLSVTVTRLSPAVLVDTESGSVELFAREEKAIHQVKPDATPPAPGTIKPLRWAAPGADGRVVTGVLGSQQVVQLPFRTWGEPVARAESLAEGKTASPPLEGLDESWLLLWYGSESPIVSTRVPESILPGPTFAGGPRTSPLYQADVPFLLVFENSPEAIRLEGQDGARSFRISFSGEAGRMAVLPLFGHDLRPAEETEGWLQSFPDVVRERCDLWADCLAEFPVDVREKVAYDAKADRVTFTERVEYVRVRPGGRRVAPLPPMLSLGWSEGLPVSFSRKPEDMRVMTQFGPVMAVPGENYSWSMDGLGGQALAERIIGPPNQESKPLQEELAAEVEKIIEAGHLAPWIHAMRRLGFVRFADPSETLHLLGEALPVLSPERQERLRAYLEAEYAAYPPHEVEALKLDEGTRREARKHEPDYYSVRQNVGAASGSPTFFRQPMPSIYRANGVVRYYEAVGAKPSDEIMDVWEGALDEALKDTDWATFAWFWGKYDHLRGHGDSVRPAEFESVVHRRVFSDTLRHVHRDAAGVIGYLRLCEMAGRPARPEAVGRLARLTALRYALARYGRHMARKRIFQPPEDPDVRELLSRSMDFTKPRNHLHQVLGVDQHGVVFYAALSRELSRYNFRSRRAKAYGSLFHEVSFLDLTPGFANILAGLGLGEDTGRFLEFFESVQPAWHAKLSDTMHFCNGEPGYMQPTDAYQFFMAHAWLAGTPPEELERYVDVPWTPMGDLYYVHKLAETIKAYRGVEYKQRRGPAFQPAGGTE